LVVKKKHILSDDLLEGLDLASGSQAHRLQASGDGLYKCLHGLAPPRHHTWLLTVPVTSVASRWHLRSAVSGCLAVTGTRTTLGRRNFAVTGATIRNNLPADLWLHSQSLLSFGQKLKQYLF